MPTAATNLAGSIRGAADDSPAWDVATVSSAVLVSGRVQVTHDGEPRTFPKLKSYTPTLGDTVVLGRYGAALFILGALG